MWINQYSWNFIEFLEKRKWFSTFSISWEKFDSNMDIRYWRQSTFWYFFSFYLIACLLKGTDTSHCRDKEYNHSIQSTTNHKTFWNLFQWQLFRSFSETQYHSFTASKNTQFTKFNIFSQRTRYKVILF